LKKTQVEIGRMPYPEFIEWLAYFKIKSDEAKEAHLEQERARTMGREKARPLKRR
jgi:hypothetical protein